MSRGDVETCWLDKRFMSNVFNTSEESSNCQVEWAVKVGENHVANIFRVRFNDASVIVKAERIGAITEWAQELTAFQKELQLYSSYMQLVKRIVGHDLTPRYFRVGELLVLEDLSPLGFVLDKRLDMIGLERGLAAFRCMAQFHAAGMIIQRRDPDSFAVLRKDVYIKGKITRELMTAIFKGMVKAVRSWPEVSEYADRLAGHAEVTFEKLAEELSRDTDLLTVIHGDLHTNNIMFKSDSTKVPPRMVDFQFSSRNSLALDILYFSAFSVQDDILDNCYDQLLLAYVDSFNVVLSSAQIPYNLSLERLKKEIDSFPCYELHSIGTRGAVFLSPDGCDLTDKVATNTLHEMCNTDVYRRRMSKIIKKHAQSGLF